MRQLDEQVNVDAGVLYRNPASAYTSAELAVEEWQHFFRNRPQMIGLSGHLPEANKGIDDLRGVPEDQWSYDHGASPHGWVYGGPERVPPYRQRFALNKTTSIS